ncbi:LLM class F420-dependent oxidoreductase [Paraconexibacter antarcticus]|uniref:LLM class F420-dependent oxidoreductase n=1 Tax=Paraconexibacter antarcticus TaxID=2949664 RepID=A0ABY5DVM5_9ACTN|nr:LLM class F420-dependent oxidoreductase [Paraconexibacter antarcticus]UTI66050.1 LLM class F420-dependent oxidoreductase [Paraconexibacter antarcticus]
MRVSLHLAYWGVGPGPTELVPLAEAAERLGYRRLWVGEAYGSDVAVTLGWIAAHTTTIGLGTAIAQIPGRTAAGTAMMAATLDTLSGGRLALGLGPSGPQVAEGFHGQTFNPQLKRTREYVDVVRAALRREPLSYHGETIRLPGGGQRAIKLMIAPQQDRVPIYLPSIGPNATRMVGEIADGWLPIFFSPEHVGEIRATVDEGLANAGREARDVKVAPTVYGRIEEDADAARDATREVTALYVGGMGSREKNFYNAQMVRYGYGDAAREVQDLYLDGRKDEAAAALPVDLLDRVGLCGPVDAVADRLAAFKAAGVDELLVSILADGIDDRLEQMRRFATAAERAGL